MQAQSEVEVPEWDQWEARRRRTMVFLLLAGLYVSGILIFRWLDYHYPLFAARNWYYFNREAAPWYAVGYRFVVTLLPVVGWGCAAFLCLTCFGMLTHRRVALVLVLAGMLFWEADMRWFYLSKKHVTWSEIQVFLSVDPTLDLGLRSSDYWSFAIIGAIHAVVLMICVLVAGPEARNICIALWNGPISKTLFGKTAAAIAYGTGRVWTWLRAQKALSLLDNRYALGAVVLLIFVDPLIVWGLDQKDEDADETRSPLRDLADCNPMRLQSLDRLWDTLLLGFSERAQDTKAANEAFADVGAVVFADPDSRLCLANRPKPAAPDNVLLIQIESLNAEMVATTEMPFLHGFAKKCLRLNRHYSTGNATHYGILGLLHGHPVSFFDGSRYYDRRSAYLDHFQQNGYKTRIVARSVLSHHYVGNYLTDSWTESTEETSNDWGAIPICHEELVKPGPRLVFTFYHHTHYPYWHQDKPQYQKYQDEVDYEFNYHRSDLILYKDKIINRYRNTLLELDDWLKNLLDESKVDLTRTIVCITGDHGEELLDQGRLGHCSSFNKYQTMPPCWLYVPGIAGGDVDFITSHADIMPTIADALAWERKPKTLGRSLFESVPFRYAIVADFEFAKPEHWAVVTEDRKMILEETSRNRLEITNLVDWSGRRLSFRADPEAWKSNLLISRLLDDDLKYWHSR